ncbi:MAG: aspartate dehydrogenase [Omnitrophica WOR_2 bacterium SM23_29]|nr:MAG: aspartate dehydrogenase [Omnitrophica WOR_2 bacterium SM23_29]
MLRIGIIGCGTIGAKLAKYIDGNLRNKAKLLALCDIDGKKAYVVANALRSKPKVKSTRALINCVDLVIESAAAKISYKIAKQAINVGKDVMVMSTGGLLQGFNALFELAEKKRCKIYLPSGALCGLDGLKGAKISAVKKVTLTTKKPPLGFKGAPYVVKRKIALDKIKSDKVLFEGNALKAIEGFPANINVAATLSLCGIGSKKTKVKIIASPRINRNIHEVDVEGEFGKLVTRTENVPSPENPKTSYLAILSAIATLNGILEQVKIGT